MNFSPKELEILYMLLFRSVYAYILEYSIESESDLDDEYREKLTLMRKIDIPTSTLWEGKLIELMKGGD